jgi:hypothetical protein
MACDGGLVVSRSVLVSRTLALAVSFMVRLVTWQFSKKMKLLTVIPSSFQAPSHMTNESCGSKLEALNFEVWNELGIISLTATSPASPWTTTQREQACRTQNDDNEDDDGGRDWTTRKTSPRDVVVDVSCCSMFLFYCSFFYFFFLLTSFLAITTTENTSNTTAPGET